MGGTLRISNFKILSKEDIKLAQKIWKPSALAAFRGEAVGVAKIYANGNGVARDRRKKLSLKSCFSTSLKY
jgi:hypothetical protein